MLRDVRTVPAPRAPLPGSFMRRLFVVTPCVSRFGAALAVGTLWIAAASAEASTNDTVEAQDDIADDARRDASAPGAADVPTRGVTMELVGSVGVAFFPGPFGAALTFGGPRVGLHVDEWRIVASFYPSLVYYADWSPGPVRPNLGFGPEVSYRHLALYSAFYFVGDKLRPTVGLGWRF